MLPAQAFTLVPYITVFYRTSTFMFVLSLALVTLCYYYKQIKRPQENFWPALARCSSSYCCATVKIFVDSINYDTIHCPTGKFSMTPSWTPRYHCDDIKGKSSVPFISTQVQSFEDEITGQVPQKFFVVLWGNLDLK